MTPTKENKRDQILQAALDLFADNGFHCSPISHLAHRAGVGVGSVYRYFSGKDELVHAVFERVDAQLRAALAQADEQQLSDREQLIAMLTRWVYYLYDHPQIFRFLGQYYHSPYGIEKKRAMTLQENFAGVPSPLQRIFSGTLNDQIKTLPVPLYQALIFGPATFLVRDALAGLIQLNETLVRSLAESCWDALKAWPRTNTHL